MITGNDRRLRETSATGRPRMEMGRREPPIASGLVALPNVRCSSGHGILRLCCRFCGERKGTFAHWESSLQRLGAYEMEPPGGLDAERPSEASGVSRRRCSVLVKPIGRSLI